tara:strand:+ start:10634 stop:11314 length:681 start_codon:yes stop_codon:yes gene_type:complete
MALQNSKLWYLEQINLLKDLSKVDFETIDELTLIKTANKNQYIYSPNEPSKVLFFLNKGRVKIGHFSSDGKEVIKSILYPGEIFGEMGVIGETERKDFAIAMDFDTRMCTINIQEFQKIIESNPKLGFELTKTIGERLRNIERRLTDLIFKDARGRVIDFIKELAVKHGKNIDTEILVKHDLTHQEMASFTATSRQTVTVILNELKERDLIYMERKRFLIRDLNKL